MSQRRRDIEFPDIPYGSINFRPFPSAAEIANFLISIRCVWFPVISQRRRGHKFPDTPNSWINFVAFPSAERIVNFRSRLYLPTSVCLQLSLSVSVCRCLYLSVPVCLCLSLFVSVYLRLSLSFFVCLCLSLSAPCLSVCVSASLSLHLPASTWALQKQNAERYKTKQNKTKQKQKKQTIEQANSNMNFAGCQPRSAACSCVVGRDASKLPNTLHPPSCEFATRSFPENAGLKHKHVKLRIVYFYISETALDEVKSCLCTSACSQNQVSQRSFDVCAHVCIYMQVCWYIYMYIYTRAIV